MTNGRCLCGTVRYEIDGPFTMMVHCHCSMCRKHTGASFWTVAAAPLAGFRWISGESSVGTYSSSGQGNRAFCRTCGSVVPTPSMLAGMVICPAANLEGDPGIRPMAHMFTGSGAPWDSITDALPQFEEYPPQAPMTAVTRPRVTPREGITEGSCLCGEVGYEVSGPPVRMMNCHCSRCRMGRSAAHATNLFYPLGEFRWTRGESLAREYRLPGARYFKTGFCSQCGAGLPHLSAERGAVIVPAGSLDTDPGMQPQAHIYADYKASWFEITGEIPQFAEMPPASG